MYTLYKYVNWLNLDKYRHTFYIFTTCTCTCMHKFQSKLSNKYDQNIVESGVKHHNPNSSVCMASPTLDMIIQKRKSFEKCIF